MKALIWLVAGCLFLAGSSYAHAQISVYGGSRSGIAFRYSSGRFSVSGILSRGGPYLGYGGPAYPCFGPVAPLGIVENRVNVQVVTPPPVVIPPTPTYDVSGVDLDLISPPERVGPRGREPLGGPGEPPGDLPGKDVSVPRRPVRPGKGGPPGKGEIPPRWKEKPPELPRRERTPLGKPEEESARQVLLGKAAFRGEEYGLAAQRFAQAIEIDPNNAEAYYYLSQARFALGHYPEAVSAIYQGMERKKDWPEADFQPRKQLYEGIGGEWALHLNRLKEAVDENPGRADLLFLQGHQCWFDGRAGEAVVIFQKARPLSPDTTYIDTFLKAALPGAVASR